jgi:hypothetical protein
MRISPLLVIVALVCWLLFVLATAAGFFTGLGALLLSLVWRSKADRLRRYASDNIHAADCSAAAFLGWSGDNTVSKECGYEMQSSKPCAFCKYLCASLDKVDPNHCEREASK